MSPYPPPPTTVSQPPHVWSHNQLTYDPLYISASSIPQLLQSLPPDLLVTLAIFWTTSPVPGGDPGKLGTFEGEENKALVQRLAQEWSSGSEDEGGPSLASALALTICHSPLPLSENDMAAVERWVEEWTSGSESESGPASCNTIPHSGLAIPKDDQASVRQLAEEWTSGSEAGNAAPALAAGNPTRLALLATRGSLQSSAQAAILAQQWRSRGESDEGSPSPGSSHSGPARSLAYAWTSGSKEDNLSPNMLTHEGMLDSDANDVGPAPTSISSESGDSKDGHGSQLMVPLSRITITPSSTTFLDFHPPYQSSLNSGLASSPVATLGRTYGPSDFDYLQDHMFKIESSDEEE